jgi:hypothetical protein
MNVLPALTVIIGVPLAIVAIEMHRQHKRREMRESRKLDGMLFQRTGDEWWLDDY